MSHTATPQADQTSDGNGPTGQPDERVSYWLNEIDAAKKREKRFREDGARILRIYEGQKSDDNNASNKNIDDEIAPFNILYSNTETLLPALYSATPRPVVQRRFKDDDPIGKAAADAGKRNLEFGVDTNVEGYETFDQAVTFATLDALLPGRAFTCVRYDAEMAEMDLGSVDAEEPEEKDDESTQYAKSEMVCLETRSWNRVYHGYAKKWSKVPWVAFEEHVDKEEMTRIAGAEIANQLVYTDNDNQDQDKDTHDDEERNRGKRKTARLYQIWDKEGGRKIRYVSEQYKENFLKVDADVLGLTGFYNCPRPLMFVQKSNNLIPTPLYRLYESQARELNRLTMRIKNVTSAIRAKGIYDSELGNELADLMKADDNELVPADKSSSLAAEKGLQNAIWFMPLEMLITTLTQLYQARQQCKQVIYEITGISDILRGTSVASETATAQNIKNQWGTLRLKRMQKEVQRYCRDLLRMMLEIAATKFSEGTWAKMTGLPYLTAQQVQQLTQLAQALQVQVNQQQLQQPPVSPALPGQPPPAMPSLSPQAQQLQQVKQQLQTLQWSQVLALLKDDIQRSYHIDIETNSTVEPEAVEDQKQITELMTALGQYMNGVGPLVQKGVMPFGVAQSMLLAITRRFRFGQEIEEYIQQMQPPKQEDDGKAAAAQEAQAKMQLEQQRMQMEAQQKQAEMQQAQATDAAKMQANEVDAQRKFKLEVEKIASLRETEAMKIEGEKQARLSELNAERQTEKMKAEIQQDTELKKATLQAATQIELANIKARQDAATTIEESTAEGERVAQTTNVMEKILETQGRLLTAIVASKSIERDG